jgi:glycosyltransferase involved in cell wall biosynthesis
MSDLKSAESPARWVFLDHCTVTGGAQISLTALCTGLKNNGYQILEVRPSTHSFFPMTIRRQIPGLLVLVLNSVYCLALSFRHGHPQWYCNSILDRLQCAFIPTNRVVTHVRDVPKSWHRLVMRLLPSQAYVVSSEFMRKRLAQILSSSHPIFVIPNVVHGGQAPLDLIVDAPNPLRILMVANLVPWKQHLKAIEAVGLLVAAGLPVRLDIWGNDPLHENSDYRETLLKSLSLLPKGIATLVEGKRIFPEDFFNYHCLLHTAEEEPFGRVLVEAMLGGLPILGLDSGNTGEFIRKYSAGLIYPSNDPDLIAGALALLSSQYMYFKKRAIRNLERVRLDFSTASAVSEFSHFDLVYGSDS